MLASASALIKAFVGNDSSEDLDVDEPPDLQPSSSQRVGEHQQHEIQQERNRYAISPSSSEREAYTKTKSLQPDATKKESLLTQALHRSPDRSSFELSSPEQSTRAHIRIGLPTPPSVTSKFSSTEDLTGLAMEISPMSNTAAQPQGVSHERIPTNGVAPSDHDSDEHEKNVEATLGRKRCITFACGANSNPAANPKEEKGTSGANQDTQKEQPAPQIPTRKSCITFAVCPHPEKPRAQSPKATGPPSPLSFQPRGQSDTVVSTSARELKNPPLSRNDEVLDASKANLAPDSPIHVKENRAPPPATETEKPRAPRISGLGDFKPSEVTQFHEFDPSSGEEDWVKDTPHYQTKLTLKDCMGKENQIRKLGEEVDKELREEEDDDGEENEDEDEDEDQDDDDDDDEDEEDGDDDDVDDDDGEDEEDELNSNGNESDIESGLEGSDGDSQGENASLWTRSSTVTTASSIERLKTPPSSDKLPTRVHLSPSRKAHRPDITTLPDSTDFICGTFDEDRPIEVAYKSLMEENRRLKHPQLPQDIDPSFPTTNDEDEEDEGTNAEQLDSNMAKIQRWFDQYDAKRARSPNGSSISNRSDRNTSCQATQQSLTPVPQHRLPQTAAGGANEGKMLTDGRTNQHARTRSPGLQHRYRSPPPPPPSRGRRGHNTRGK